MEQKYSLFQIEKIQHYSRADIGQLSDVIIEKCFILIDTFDTLEVAYKAKHLNHMKTIIIPTY